MAWRRNHHLTRLSPPVETLPSMPIPEHIADLREAQRTLGARVQALFDETRRLTLERMQPHLSQSSSEELGAELWDTLQQRLDLQRQLDEMRKQEGEWLDAHGGAFSAVLLQRYRAILGQLADALSDAARLQTLLRDLCLHGQRELRGRFSTPTVHLNPGDLTLIVAALTRYLEEHKGKGEHA
jgi:hypothetical protein